MGLGLTLSTCRNAPPLRAVAAVGAGEVLVIDDGDSSQPSLSSDGNQLAYVGAKRSAHVSTQIYVKNLLGKGDRRVTFQNGVVQRPRFHPRENLIVYASSTDEDKEYPVRLREGDQSSIVPAWLRQPAEIYEHGLDTFDIRRLVTHEGFDGDPHFVANGRGLTWTRVDGTTTSVVTINRDAALKTTEVKKLGVNPSEYTVAGDQRTAAWVSYDAKFDHARLMLRQMDRVTEVGAARSTLKTDPAFSPEGIFLFWSEFDATQRSYTLFVRNLLKDCEHEIPFAATGNRRHPTLSPDGTTLYYTAIGGDRSRIASTTFDRAICR